MDRRNSVIIACCILAAFVIFAFIYYQKATIDTSDTTSYQAKEWETAPAEKPKDVLITPKTVLTAKHAYRNGEHVVAGEIPLPTPCHILESNGTASADKKQVFIEFTSSVKSGEVCAETITPARFKVSVRADKNAKISSTLNGKEVILNLIEAGPNENLDNFELYIKG